MRLVVAYGLMGFLIIWLVTMLWWWWHQSHRRTEARSQVRRGKESDARALALMAKEDKGDLP